MTVSCRKTLAKVMMGAASFLLFGILAGFAPEMAIHVCAQEVVITPNEVDSINEELEKGNDVKLVPGETYDFPHVVARSNTTIDATGAIIYGNTRLICSPRNSFCGEYDYDLTNFTVKGGTWRNYNPEGHAKTAMEVSYAKNIVFDGLDMEYCNYEGHSIEITACSNVTIKNCRIMALGTPEPESNEEQIQIDIASTSANVPFLPDSLLTGETCHDIKILNNVVTGSRAVCTNFTKAAYSGNCHTNIVVEGNILTGMTSEALALFNTTSGSVKSNVCISMAKKGSSSRSESYYSGCHIRMQRRVDNGDAYAKRRIKVSGNTFKGERFGLKIGSADADGFSYVAVSKNNVYSALANFSYAYRYDSRLEGKIAEYQNVRFRQPVDQFVGSQGRIMAKMISRMRISGKKKLTVGKSMRLKAVLAPSNASIKKVKWRVSNPRYASISSSGKLKAKKAGKGRTIIVCASSTDGYGVKAYKKIKIIKKKKKKKKK